MLLIKQKQITSIVIIVKYGAQETKNSMETAPSIFMVLIVLLEVNVAALGPARLVFWLPASMAGGCTLAAATVRPCFHR